MKRKAVTPVIAVVLLLMMTVAVGGVAFMWVTQMQKGMQDDITKQQEEMTKKASASLVVDAAWATILGGLTHITIRNNGQYTYTATEMDAMQIHYNGVPQGNLAAIFDDAVIPTSPCVGNALAPGETCEALSLVATNMFPWTGGSGWEFTLRLIEPNTEVSISKYCRMNSNAQITC